MAEITLKLRAPTQEKSIKLKDDETVKELRSEAAKAFDVAPSRVCLIYAGKILKDEHTLTEHKLKDGLTVHIVIKQESLATAQSSSTTSAPTHPAETVTTAQTRPGADFGSLSATAAQILGNSDGSGNNFASMQQAMQQQVMRNPELLRNMMNSPLVQSLMSNPELMRTIMQSNPQMRELMDRNPELNQMLSNPDVLRQSMEIASNPSMMQEMMRSYDRAVLNMESIPGGSNHLQRIYRDIQEPMMDAMRGGDSSNPFADLAGGINRQAAPSNEPMPNPWASAPSATTGTSAPMGTSNANTSASSAPPSSAATDPSGGGTTLLPGGLPFSPEAMSSAFSTPYVRQLLETMSQNPETMESLLSANPIWGGGATGGQDPATRDQLRRMVPQLTQQLGQPGFINMLSNPRAMRAMGQIQEGLQVLQQEAPEVFSNMLGGNFAGGHVPPTASTDAAPGSAAPPSTTTETGGPAATAAPPTLGNVELATLMASLLNMAPGSAGAPQTGAPTAQQSPEEQYAVQLQTLASMGFTNQTANIQALIFSRGDVNAAIDRLLGN